MWFAAYVMVGGAAQRHIRAFLVNPDFITTLFVENAHHLLHYMVSIDSFDFRVSNIIGAYMFAQVDVILKKI